MYPPISPHDSGMLAVEPSLELYWETSGNPEGIPVLYLHGGPGDVLGDGYRRQFDPERYRIIGLQQRGAGRSTPAEATPERLVGGSDTSRLVADLEALREHLGIGSWLLSGVSWGCTLAFHYALAHRERVRGMVLVAVTTTSPDEVAWTTEGVGMLYPEAWQRLADAVAQHSDWRPGSGRLVDAVAQIMVGADAGARVEMALAWMDWQQTHVQIGLPVDQLRPVGPTDGPIAQQVALTTLMSHYWSRHAAVDEQWLPGGPVLARLGDLEGLPVCMVHGRRDVSVPVQVPWSVKAALPGAQLHVVEAEGRGGEHVGRLWCRATDSFASTGDFQLLSAEG